MTRGGKARTRAAKARQSRRANESGAPPQVAARVEAEAPIAPVVEPPLAAPEVPAPIAPAIQEPPAPVAEAAVEERMRSSPVFQNASNNFVLRVGTRMVVFSKPSIRVPNVHPHELWRFRINPQPSTSRSVDAAPPPPEEAVPGPSYHTRSNGKRVKVVTPSMAKFTRKVKQRVLKYIGKSRRVGTANSTTANDNSWIPVFINDITKGGIDNPTKLTVDDVTEWFQKFSNVFTPEVIRNLRNHCWTQTGASCATGIETSGNGLNNDYDPEDVVMDSYSSSSSDSEED